MSVAKQSVIFLYAGSLLGSVGSSLTAQRTTSTTWRMIWQDEFSSAGIDTTKWGFDLGNGFYADSGKTFVSGWGNDELQCYTAAPRNTFVADGLLHIVAQSDSGKGCAYSSARLKTRRSDGSALFAQRYGRFEFRAKLPPGRGIWPALWLLPQDDAYGTWAASGEIDVMEARGQTPSTVLGTLHYGSRWPHNAFSGTEYVFPNRGSITDFHVYAMEWEPGRMRWFVDGVACQTQTFWWSSSQKDGRQGMKPANESELNPWPAPFDQRFYIVMNLAVGGRFLGNPDATTPFPAEMLVDYVRVYERRGGARRVLPRGTGTIPFAKP
jgi:beta-glucanase (GH16 family)